MRYQRIEGLPFQRMGEEILVVVPRGRDVHLLNETSARIWDLLEKPVAEEEVVDALLEVFDAKKADVRRDVATLLREMKQKGLLEEV